MEENGRKYDADKLRWDLLDLGLVEEVVKILTFGAKKYTRDGWLEVPNGEERYRSAGLRHWLYESSGEVIDTDSQLYHKAHKAWNALAELELFLRKVELIEEPLRNYPE